MRYQGTQTRNTMLNRQKVLLLMLETAGRPVQRVELMKWCFLLRHEADTGGGSSFYDFVPYRLGPFSFGLYQEINRLEELSYVIGDDVQTWCLNQELRKPAFEVSAVLREDVRGLVSKFRRFSPDELLDYVYARYPEFTINSVRRRLARRPTANIAVYTAGYETLSVDRFLNMLVQNGIEQLIDVRNNPVSRRYGFHKSTLARLSVRLGIAYHHFPELGIRPEIRRYFDGLDDRATMFHEYERTTLQGEKDALRSVSRLLTEKPSVLVCLEAEPDCCHRSRLAKPLAELTDLPIVHLRP
jgi:uncharacterized protein (DUF488 family)